MAWIETIKYGEADEALRRAFESLRTLYPAEYARPSNPGVEEKESIIHSHSLIPDALHHAFGTFGVLMSPELPLSRRQHEMIATMVSVVNRCRY